MVGLRMALVVIGILVAVPCAPSCHPPHEGRATSESTTGPAVAGSVSWAGSATISTVPVGPAAASALPVGPAAASALPVGPATASALPVGPATASALPVGPATTSTAPVGPATAAALPTMQPQEARGREIRFTFRPSHGPAAPYATDAPEDQPRVVLPPGVVRGAAYPVVVGLHGQPKRGTPPRDYEFAPAVLRVVDAMRLGGQIRPFVLALPVFRFEGENWPGFDLREFRDRVEALLAAEGLRSDGYFVFGHSGAAGCGGGGLNRAAGASPKGVAFLDTCVGSGFVSAVRALAQERVPTWIVHSVETAGFVPRQATEYRTDFDFGRVDGPIGLRPVPCPAERPEGPLRAQAFQCSATPDGILHGFVVDTGAGEAAHNAALEVGVRFFLQTVLSAPKQQRP